MLHLLLVLVSTGFVQAREVTSDSILPKFQNRPILSLTSSEQRESAKTQTDLLLSRASRVCELLQQPPGNFRSRRAVQVTTQRFLHDGRLAALERKGNGSVNGRMLDVAKDEASEVFKSLKCIGSN